MVLLNYTINNIKQDILNNKEAIHNNSKEDTLNNNLDTLVNLNPKTEVAVILPLIKTKEGEALDPKEEIQQSYMKGMGEEEILDLDLVQE